MKLFKLMMTGVVAMSSLALLGADYTVSGQYVTIPVKDVKTGSPQMIRLQVVSDNIIRVQATSEAQLPEKQSLIVVGKSSER